MLVDKECVGSKWWSVDFHCHTPASSDYGKGENQAILKSITPTEYLLYYMRKNINCIVITDHNTGEWIDRLNDAYVEMKEAENDEFREIAIFPGVEISVNGNIHVLAIFPEDRNTADINKLLGSVEYVGTRGESDACTEQSFTKVIDVICAKGGIAIPAHCNNEKGLFIETKGTTLEQGLSNSNIFSAELTESEYEYPQLYKDKKLEWCRVLGSDAHHPTGKEGEKFHGSHYTWIKMTTPSFQGLELALKDGNMSVICSDECMNNPNEFSHAILEKLEISNAMYLGRKNLFVLKFNPWLNCVIGGRGTGKSTIAEFLRIVLNRTMEIPTNLKSDFEKYGEKNTGKNSNGLMLENTNLCLYYTKDGQSYKANWTYESSTTDVQKFDGENWIKSEGDIENRFPVRIYSQKQIFELAKNPQALLYIIDNASGLDYDEWKEGHQKLVSKYYSLSANIRELQLDVENEANIKGEMEDADNKIKLFNATDSAELLKEYSESKQLIAKINKLEVSYKEKLEVYKKFNLEVIENKNIFEELNNQLEEEAEVIEAFKNLNDSCMSAKKKLEETVQNLEREFVKWMEKKQDLKAICKNIEVSNKYNELKETLKQVGMNDVDGYSEIIEQKNKLKIKMEIIGKRKAEVNKIVKEKEEVYRKIKQSRSVITKRRIQFLKDIVSNNKFVNIEVVPYSNKEEIQNQLRTILGKEKGFERSLGDGESDGKIADIIYTSDTLENGIDLIKEQFKRMFNGEKVSEHEKRFNNLIHSISVEQMDKIMCWFPEDSVKVSYKKTNGKLAPIENASPGQKTAALLAFILSYGKEPLILDQPEDDLDNSLISNLIVNNIREGKIKRQILIVTHNANIVVNGDADNVAVLHIAGGNTQINSQDGLQDIGIRKLIC
ncbi:AAA family ATPase [Clostridium estertheticum]|uniref:TrlF family AAA-like ATPase n=1 Tax=Clostridium estertheticum TaxID=238834 RepID=UPI001C7E0FDC|nr:AAA family ATPase [Clostridium estertheticum]MBX4258554.1 AAA family ATPase [Clostridium estertheticum]WLC69968.1 AAA family ATPase [Clostridium estertheticum]